MRRTGTQISREKPSLREITQNLNAKPKGSEQKHKLNGDVTWGRETKHKGERIREIST